MPPDCQDRFQCHVCGQSFVVPSLARDCEAAHIRSALGCLDGSTLGAVKLLTGATDEEIADLGGLHKGGVR